MGGVMAEEYTTLKILSSLRDRLKVLAAIERITMQEWVERRVKEHEETNK
jgi:hypothetical protein